MSATITAAANIYNECNAISGWLEMACAFFDDVLVMDCGPAGKPSNDGTIEIVKKWGVRLLHDEIDKGFGAIRTRLIRESRTDYVLILDGDERFLRYAPLLKCEGQPTPQEVVDSVLQEYSVTQRYDTADGRTEPGKVPQNWENLRQLGLDLRVSSGGVHDQGAHLRKILDTQRPDVIAMVRRHWHDFTLARPTQNWYPIPDYQYRLIRCDDKIAFDPDKKMHEQLRGFDPAKVHFAHSLYGPFLDHFHFAMKRLEPDQRREDVAIYNAIHEGKPVPS